jgi:hypothetical protein
MLTEGLNFFEDEAEHETEGQSQQEAGDKQIGEADEYPRNEFQSSIGQQLRILFS